MNVSIASFDEAEDETVFTYIEGTDKGPKEWGKLDPHWKLCDTRKLQSPIDIPSGKLQLVPSLGKLKMNYNPVPAVLKNRGHDIKHSPSEHTFNGTRYALELHMVHKSDHGEMAVTAVVYKYGRPDPFLSRVCMLNTFIEIYNGVLVFS
ncbi:hypothetical protein F3Y22_tig00110895pilonHSYRG00365 [Hibiscus syriacus]|uniref:Alpha-carbonic anhydrase domain-containing protein n=1 Tax=Hibiscus syriacus TaxID=106335 RepID=A0A6A2ZH13_HIBSY|nr:hypothetical protein F3Y22_tig00110895pilonHSYRG00365 [Hibiscus syriacus]